MTKVVYNSCYGGFGLSNEGKRRYEELAKRPMGYAGDLDRTDPILVRLVEEGKYAGQYADLSIRDVPEGTKYRIDEYDGYESVMTIDDYEWSVA